MGLGDDGRKHRAASPAITLFRRFSAVANASIKHVNIAAFPAISVVKAAITRPGRLQTRFSHASAGSFRRILSLLSSTPTSQTEMIETNSKPQSR